MNTFINRLQHSGYLIPSALLGYLWVKGQQPGIPGLSCLMRSMTGIPCPTCFLTRATCSALTGNIAESVQHHAFGPIAAATLIYWAIWSIKAKQLVPNELKIKLFPISIAALIFYWIARLSATAWWPSVAIFHFPD
jgi:hypothetical protein